MICNDVCLVFEMIHVFCDVLSDLWECLMTVILMSRGIVVLNFCWLVNPLVNKRKPSHSGEIQTMVIVEHFVTTNEHVACFYVDVFVYAFISFLK